MKKDRLINLIICMIVVVYVSIVNPILDKYLSLPELYIFIIVVVSGGALGFILYYPIN
ncbi:hypothetical protein RD055328_12690 [Companilactobacillus sp. RD055328]|nr:hypothetical protein RD055328_12690 [Companilactobacillus sp. RD055328]